MREMAMSRALAVIEVDGELLGSEPSRRRTVSGSTDSTLRRIDLTVKRLAQTHDQRPPARRAGFLAARMRLQLARVRRFRQLQ